MEGEKTYMSGFNSGYKLAKFQPDLVEKIQSSLSESVEFDRGLLDGIKQWEQEKEKIRAEELNNLSAETEEQENDLSR
jgi:hypothetical protein